MKETAIFRTNEDEKSENDDKRVRDKQKARGDVSAEERIPSHSFLWERKSEYQR